MKALIVTLVICASFCWSGESTPLETAKELAWKISRHRQNIEVTEKAMSARPTSESDASIRTSLKNQGIVATELEQKLEKIIKDNNLKREDVNKVFAERKDVAKKDQEADATRWKIEMEKRRLEANERANNAPTPPKRIGE